ncbi:HNH endonuclease signature motif containing protein [Microbacterium fluvii]
MLPGPDGVGLVVEAADMMAVFAARRLRMIEVARAEAMVEFQRLGREFDQIGERSFRLEVAAALRITEHAAGQLIGTAAALTHRYPRMLGLLERAGTTERHAQLLAELLDRAEPGTRDRVMDDAIEAAELLPVGSFRRRLGELIALTEHPTLEDRFTDAVAGRRVVVERADDAMAWLMILLPAVEAHAVFERATAQAKVLGQVPGETRTLDQLRADVVADLLIDGDCQAHPDTVRGIRATVAVTVPALTLLTEDTGHGPAAVDGVGPIPLSQARELCGAADGGWMRVLTHPETGIVLSVGRDRYRPPTPLRQLAAWRSGRCMAPGCALPTTRCDIDHSLAWEHGGHTAAHNLCPLCRGHHTIKHHGLWTVNQTPDGTVHWHSPTGRHYTVHPERRTPTFTPDTLTPATPAPF